MREISAAKLKELKSGEMKAVKVDDENEVLLCKVGNKFYAVTARCPHYGAPLAEGILTGNIIICPWHHSCFNAENGDLLEPPSLDALQNYEVKIDGENIKIKVPEKIERSRVPAMVNYEPENDDRSFVIVGAGAAGNAAAEALRQNGFKGKITMITFENRAPYDRPNLSKAYLQGEAPEEWMPLRPENFYKDNGIEMLYNKYVKELDINNKKISFEDGEDISFDKVLLAAGGAPRTLKIPGSDLKNIFYLRSFDSSDDIIKASKTAKNIIIIGGSFIGMETAFSLRKRRKINVTVISPDEIPFEKIFGKEIGNLFKKQHEKEGISFKLKSKAEKFEGKEKVEAVILDKGQRIEADLVIAGIGVKPATDFIKGIDLQKDGSIKTDKYFKIKDDIYAAGDIAAFPDWRTGEYTRIEHWRTAEQQGRTAGFNMAGKEKPYKSVPFFWTKQAGLGLVYVGHAAQWDEIIIQGDVASKDFIAFYIKDNKILASAGNNRSKEMAAIHELMRLEKLPSPDEIRNKEFDPLKYLKDKSS